VRSQRENLAAPVIGVTRAQYKLALHEPVDERRDVRWLHDEAHTQLSHRRIAVGDEREHPILIRSQSRRVKHDLDDLCESHDDRCT
jgi:hypothetical protein